VPRYGRIDTEYGQHLATSQTDEPIYMLSLTKFRPEADDSERGTTGRLADARYAPLALLSTVGATLCFVADVVAGSGDWDQVAVVSYPTRRSFIDIAMRRDFQDWHLAKQAGMDRTAVMGTVPVTKLPDPATKRLVLLEVWNGQAPAQVADGPAVAFDVEGTVIGDGRSWSGARYTTIEPGTALPLQEPRPDYQALLLEPAIEHWQWSS
jgi:hypothetical protein